MTVGNGEGNFFADEATAIEPAPDGLVVEVGTGRRYEVDGAVLAVGKAPRRRKEAA